MMIGLEVAPVAPRARFCLTSSGSTESSQSLVPAWMIDCSGLGISGGFLTGRECRLGVEGNCIRLREPFLYAWRVPAADPLPSPPRKGEGTGGNKGGPGQVFEGDSPWRD